jgi:hypothetical protein
MLYLRYNNIVIISIFLGKELKIISLRTMNKNTLFPMLLKTHKFLHLLATFESMAKRTSDEDFNLDIVEIT